MKVDVTIKERVRLLAALDALAPEACMSTLGTTVLPIVCTCGCIFLPSVDGTELYPDRFVMAGGCNDPDCECHDIPAVIEWAES